MTNTMIAVAALAILASAPAVAQTGEAGQDAATLMNQHADLSSAIQSTNVGQLQQIWSFQTTHPVSHVPLISDGRVYFGDWGGTVYAVDASSGEKVWQQHLYDPKMEWPWHGFAGTGALGGGTLFEASTEGDLFALDAETGDLKWRTRIAEDEHAGSISKLTYYDGVVFVGLQSVEEPLTKMKDIKPDFQGGVLAVEAETGEVVWERRLVQPPHNGVAVWSSFAIDPALDLLYFTTGNNYTGEATELSDSIVAVNLGTGEIVWNQQVTSNDVWTMADQKGPDYDFAAGPQLFEATIGGEERMLVGAGQKSGYFFVWDRETGEPIWFSSIGYGGIDGGMHGEASIGEDRILAWSNNSYVHREDPTKHPLSIKALDPATGDYLWVKNQAQPAWVHSAGFLASDVYFVGSLDGKLRAYRADDGEEIWSTQAPGPITASVWVDTNLVVVPTGAPKLFGGWAKGRNTITAYALPKQ